MSIRTLWGFNGSQNEQPQVQWQFYKSDPFFSLFPLRFWSKTWFFQRIVWNLWPRRAGNILNKGSLSRTVTFLIAGQDTTHKYSAVLWKWLSYSGEFGKLANYTSTTYVLSRSKLKRFQNCIFTRINMRPSPEEAYNTTPGNINSHAIVVPWCVCVQFKFAPRPIKITAVVFVLSVPLMR